MTQRPSALDRDGAALLAAAAELAAQELEAAASGPVFAEPPSAARIGAALRADAPLPVEGVPDDTLLDELRGVLAAGRRTSPAFFGYVQSPPTAAGVAADLLASAADQNVTAWRSAPAAVTVERQVVRWLGELTRFGADAHGLLVGGGSAANLTALLLAVHAADPAADRRALVVYASPEVHFSVVKAAAVLGMTARRVALDALGEAVAADRAAGRIPCCLVGSAGTTATGAVEPLDALADLAAAGRLWFHVDGAYGAPAAAVLPDRFAGIERADSLCVDAHKWLYAPVDCSALLVRDPAATARAFAGGSDDYVRVLAAQDAEAFAFWDHGIELSRRFRALKLWATLRSYGARRITAAVAEDIGLAEHMAERVREADDLELLAHGLSICCFRHLGAGVEDLDAHNERLLHALQRDGRAYLSNATVDGRFALRACITNFRTTREDVERTLDLVRELGAVA